MDATLAPRRQHLAVIFAAALGLALVTASGVLWAVYGGRVFVETVLAGLALCF